MSCLFPSEFHLRAPIFLLALDPSLHRLFHPRFTTPVHDPIQSSRTLSTKHFPHRISVPIPRSRLRSKSYSPVDLVCSYFGFLYVLISASHRLKRPLSSSLHRILHHFTSIPPNRSKLVAYVASSVVLHISRLSVALCSFLIGGGSSNHVYKFTTLTLSLLIFTTACVSYPRS